MIDHIISQSCYKAVTRSLGFRMALYIFKQLYNQKSFPPCADTTPIYKQDACLTKKSNYTFHFFSQSEAHLFARTDDESLHQKQSLALEVGKPQANGVVTQYPT